ncbi:hypothetical protein KR026_000556 [Drosophila bipectinata]|nr:hypothetical protein KR026_000556 [Drosophila bipectinata]
MHSCSLLPDPAVYQPDTLDLNTDAKAADYWFACFRDLATKFAKVAEKSQAAEDTTAAQRAEQFREAYIQRLEEHQRNIPQNSGKVVLGTSELLKLNETMLRRYGFTDPWLTQKKLENASAVSKLKQRLQELDSLQDQDAKWTELVRGVLAGNMFDWGAQAIANILEQDSNFGLHSALDRIEQRPWLLDNLDNWLQRLKGEPHKCAVVFVDNSGVDVVLGVLPFARELVKRGTKVILCANSEPSLNDVTSRELESLLEECSRECEVLSEAWRSRRLLVYANGQSGPCLDMRTLPPELCDAIAANETDLLVIEGMGRALHTNLNARFGCETLKLAVIKNRWLAKYLGGEAMFAVICKFEPAAS